MLSSTTQKSSTVSTMLMAMLPFRFWGPDLTWTIHSPTTLITIGFQEKVNSLNVVHNYEEEYIARAQDNYLIRLQLKSIEHHIQGYRSAGKIGLQNVPTSIVQYKIVSPTK